MADARGRPRTGPDRRSFLGGLGAAWMAAAPVTPVAAQDVPALTKLRAGRRALVLAGGANRGAYQAGVIGGLVALLGLSDGEPLPFDAVCGTSIGAINGYLVATAQYTRLRDLWRQIAGRDIFALKRKYRNIGEPSSGVLTRAYEAIALAFGLVKSETGILDPTRIDRLIAEIVEPDDAVHMPLYISTTNLTRETGELFVRRATTPAGLVRQRDDDRLIRALPYRPLRTATDDTIRLCLRASAAIPIVFDPVAIPRADGSGVDVFVDGGVTDNVPIEIARRTAQAVHVIQVDPAAQPIVEGQYANALEVGLGVFETMQRNILDYQVLLAIAESAIVPTELTEAAGLVPLSIDPYLIRPDAPLPGTFGDFSNLADLDAAWQRGYDDGVKGWRKFDPGTIRAVSAPG